MYRLWVLSSALVIAWVLATADAGQPAEAPDGDYEYVGVTTCKKCHYEIWKSWSETKMANTFQVLKPDSKLKPSKKTGLTAEWIAQIKTNKPKGQPKIDSEKDYTRDADCLRCHTTGYGKAGGYAIPDPKDKKAQRKARKLEGVSCESCHGPGSKYVKIFKEIQEKKRPYTSEELYAAGLTKIGEKTCAVCHSKDSPLVGDDYVFDYEKRKAEGVHKHVKLELRKE